MRRLLLSTALALRLVPAAAQGGVDRCAQLQDPRRLVEEGLRQYRAGFADQRPAVSRQRYEQALRCYERAIEHSLNPAKIHHPLGLVYEKLGRPEEALAAYERFLAEVPEEERSAQVTRKIEERIASLREQRVVRQLPDPPVPPAPPPPQVDAVVAAPASHRGEPRIGLIAAGSSLFGDAYLFSVLAGALCDPLVCGPRAWSLYVPLVGPFIAMSSYRDSEDYALVMASLFLDGFLQVGGATMVVLGAAVRQPVRAVSLHPLPGGAGLAVGGRL